MIVITAVGLFLSLVGAALAGFPDALRQTIRGWISPRFLWAAATLRTGIGFLFLTLAPQTRLPVFFYALGGLSLFSGLAIPVIGVERASRFLNVWLSQRNARLRLWGVVAGAMGLLITWASR